MKMLDFLSNEDHATSMQKINLTSDQKHKLMLLYHSTRDKRVCDRIKELFIIQMVGLLVRLQKRCLSTIQTLLGILMSILQRAN